MQIRPLEEAYKFGSFFSSLLTESDFEAKPSVLLLGQYSTGKTTFIKHLLGRDYPGIHIGPEPTTGQLAVQPRQEDHLALTASWLFHARVPTLVVVLVGVPVLVVGPDFCLSDVICVNSPSIMEKVALSGNLQLLDAIACWGFM